MKVVRAHSDQILAFLFDEGLDRAHAERIATTVPHTMPDDQGSRIGTNRHESN